MRIQYSRKWLRIVCGGTAHQAEMTALARRVLASTRTQQLTFQHP
jgi:hypothetical protein